MAQFILSYEHDYNMLGIEISCRTHLPLALASQNA